MFVISASYGNDSRALIQWAREACLGALDRVVVAYCDTGWASPTWESEVVVGESLAAAAGFEHVRIANEGFAELVRRKQGFPGNQQQFCTAWLKGFPYLEWLDRVDPDRTAVTLVGKRRAESRARADTPEWVQSSEYHGDRPLWHPLYAHDDAMRDALLARAGLAPLPHRSLECNPCVNANRGDILRLTPSEVARVSALEVEVGKPMFRPKRFSALGIHGVVVWARHGKNHEADVDDEVACFIGAGCGL